jgi:hypothetical protein
MFAIPTLKIQRKIREEEEEGSEQIGCVSNLGIAVNTEM